MIVQKHWPTLLLIVILFFQVFYFLIVSNRPNQIVPEGRVYNVLGKNFYYPSMIRQGMDGFWGIKDTHTTRETPFVHAQLFFVFAGKIGGLFNIDPVSMFQLLRLTGAISSTLALFIFARFFFPERWAFVATALAVALETGPTFASLSTIWNLVPGWDVHTIYERRFALPHHTWGDAFGFIFFLLLFKIFLFPPKKDSPIFSLPNALYWLSLFITGWWATTTLPSYIVPYIGLAGPAILFLILRNSIHIRQYLLPVLFAVCGIILAAFIFHVEFSKGTPWKEWNSGEKTWMTHEVVTTQYLHSLTYYYPLILIAIAGSILRRKKMTTKLWFVVILSLFWIFGPLAMIPFSKEDWFPFANFRLVDLHGYAPAGFISAIGIWHLLSLVSSGKKRTIAGICIGLFITFVSVFTTWQYTKQIFSLQNNLWTNTYPSKLTWQGVLFMEELPQGSNVMVREFFGEMLPAFGPVSSFIGGGHNFPDWFERQWISQYFYSGTLVDTEAFELLKRENITHVFWGPDEKSLLQSNTFYPTILEPLFQNTDVTVFRVQ